jgi:hypothetical protein
MRILGVSYLFFGLFLINLQTVAYAQEENDTLVMFRSPPNETTWTGTNVSNAINESDETADDIASGIFPK